jgi:hypothetical protein
MEPMVALVHPGGRPMSASTNSGLRTTPTMPGVRGSPTWRKARVASERVDIESFALVVEWFGPFTSPQLGVGQFFPIASRLCRGAAPGFVCEP